MDMPARDYSYSGYRYSYNGKEHDDEVNDGRNSLDFGARILDPRIGRFFNIDTKAHSFPFYSPYLFAGNMPIIAVDLDGEKVYVVIDGQTYEYTGTSNNIISSSIEVMQKTTEGANLINRYSNSTTEDLYINSGQLLSSGANVKAVTIPNSLVQGMDLLDKSNGEIDIYNVVDDELAVLWGNWDGFKPENTENMIHLVTINENDLNDKYKVAYLAEHELYFHLVLEDLGIFGADEQHDAGGEQYYGGLDNFKYAASGSCAQEMRCEISQVKVNDKIKAEKQEKFEAKKSDPSLSFIPDQVLKDKMTKKDAE